MKLLIDGDLLVYRATAAKQEQYTWPNGAASAPEANIAQAWDEIEADIGRWMSEVKGSTDFVVALSDDLDNYRKHLWPTYKGNRKGARPVALYDLKERLREELGDACVVYPSIEADDVLGILQTKALAERDRTVIVSWDKDMLTVPGRHYNPRTGVKVTVSKEEGRLFHLKQTLTGDSTDNYPGCPGIGAVGAEPIVDGWGFHRQEKKIKFGLRAGETSVFWRAGLQYGRMDPWPAVVSAYEMRGLTEADALTQARLAHILQWDPKYAFNPYLWRPDGAHEPFQPSPKRR
jgi:DNA polymerase I